MSDLTTWQRRWAKTSADLAAANDEITRLRTALDTLNADTEQLFNDAGQEGIEKAKTHLIERQAACIKELKKDNK